MKAIVLIALSLISTQSFATSDALTSAWIVVQNVQDDQDFGVQQTAVMGCYGVAQGPQLTQFTSEYNVKDTVGCGIETTGTIDINALSCATLVDAEESADFASFKKITLDISKCAYKDNAKFITMVRTAAARNFPQTKKGKIVKGKEVNLVLLK